MPNETTVLLVDLSSILHPIWHVSQREPDRDFASQRTIAAVRKLAAEYPHTAICCDSPKSFRKELDPTYKANRPRADAALHHQMDLARATLAADGFPVWRVDGFEGDDLIATAVHRLASSTRHGANGVLIASADKDLLALVNEKVEVHNTRTGDRIGVGEVHEKLGLDPGQLVDYLTLVGDAADNVKGAQGIGPATAAGLLTEFSSLGNIYRAIDDCAAINGLIVEGLKPAQRASLEDLRPRLDNVRALVTMRTDVPLDVLAVFRPRVPQVKDAPQDRIRVDPVSAAPTSTQIAEAAPVEWERGLEPRSMNDAVRLSQRLFDSQMFAGYGMPQAILGTILLGRELGLPAMAALRSVHVIEGKHSLSADLMVALVLKSGLAEYFQLVESTDKICTFSTHRKGAPEPTTLSYTIEQAEQAGLLFQRPGKQPGPWHKIPKQMLRARCKSELARLEYPDLLAGLYTPEELRDANGH